MAAVVSRMTLRMAPPETGMQGVVGGEATRRGGWAANGQSGADAVQGRVKFRDVNVSVVQRAVAAVGEQLVQLGHARWVAVGGAFDDRGDLEQLGPNGG